MSGNWLSVIAAAVAGFVACLALVKFNLLPGMRAAAPDVGASPGPTPSDKIADILPPLSRTLSPLAEEVSHPRELLDMSEFRAVVTALRRPDATLLLLKQYALGGNWPMACAAFTVLAEHPERQSLRDAVLKHLDDIRPYVLTYALQFLNALEDRPPAGAPLLAVSEWWVENPVIVNAYDEYLARRAELGDKEEFGEYLAKKENLAAPSVIGLLKKIQLPLAEQLATVLGKQEESRVDRSYLASVGVVRKPSDRDPLLVVPPAWQDLLATAEAAIRQARPRSLLITGEPRIGKTTFLDLLGGQLQTDGWTVFSASGDELMADQQYFGQLEGRVRKLIDALHSRRKLVWFVRDFAHIASSGMSQGQPASILDQILPALTDGNLVIVGEASQAAATRLFQSRPSLRSMMEVLILDPMNDVETLALAKQVGERITSHIGVAVSEEAVEVAMELAQHYLGSGQMPGVVLDLLKRAANRAVRTDETALTANSVIATLSQMSGLPTVILDTGQRIDLAEVQKFFASRVIGQDEATKAVVDRIAMLKAGLTDPDRPIGVFLFAGPTGTGKTELAKTLAEYLFGSADRMTRLDMSEFQTSESTNKILGHVDDSGMESLIDRIRKQPFSVVLLDEFEKAHANCWDLFLQIFDDGRLSDARGREADFRHCFIILTSNLGATVHQGAGMGFRPDHGRYNDEQVQRTIAQTFRPEFVNRLDRIIVFQPLSRELMRDILHKELAGVQERRGLRDRAWAVEWEASAIEFLLDRGFSPEMGARPLKRAIDQLLLAPLAATLVEHRFPEGDQFLFVRSNGRELEVEFVDPDAEPVAAAALEAEVDGGVSLASIVLRQSGSAVERASLAAYWRELDGELRRDSWLAAGDRIRLALADPAIWTRDDRFRVFSSLELMERVTEASRTASRLFERYEAASGRQPRASRELAGRLALQLYNLRQGLDDVAAGAPIDALLRVSVALDAGGEGVNAIGWCRTLTGMYRQWAAKRHMRMAEIAPGDPNGVPLLQVTGFGAYRTLAAEAGLHVLEEHAPENSRRTVARVTVVAGPDREASKAVRHDAFTRLLAAAPSTTAIVRRYREEPAPLVRDIAKGWRTGRLDAVLAGDFDLIAAVAKRAAPT
ncbi:MAG TPA: AAA family ATPase [Vineibacter sp.]|nr:AAA family ATPase [Vineibacter sp.]